MGKVAIFMCLFFGFTGLAAAEDNSNTIITIPKNSSTPTSPVTSPDSTKPLNVYDPTLPHNAPGAPDLPLTIPDPPDQVNPPNMQDEDNIPNPEQDYY